MIITANQNNIEPGQQVNRLGKYLYKNLDGAYKIDRSGNTCDVYVTLLYQLPKNQRIPGKGKEYNDVHEMTLDINITTYSKGLRLYVIELTPEERTIGYMMYPYEKLKNLEFFTKTMYNDMKKQVSKKYIDYDFLF